MKGPEPAPRRLRTDPDLLRHLLILLAGTAVVHAESEVSFWLTRDDEGLHAVLGSDGPPFPAAAEALFEPFDEHAQSFRRHGGRSLTLTLSKELALALGGTLRAENRGGRPTFDLFLPAALP